MEDKTVFSCRMTRRQWMLECARLLALAAIGCGRREDPVRLRRSTVVIAYSYGWHLLSPAESDEAARLLFLPLVSGYKSGELKGKLARSWEHSPDYHEWIYNLRTDVRWHDGVAVTADDIKFTIDLMLRHDTDVTSQAVESVTVIDSSTVKIRYKQPNNGWVSWTVYYPKHLLMHLDPEKFYEWDFWIHPVGNGPYRFVRYLPETSLEFKANPDYYKGKPKIEHVTLKFVKDSGLIDLLSGNVDAIPYTNPMYIPKLAKDPRFRVYYGISLNAARAVYWQNHYHLFLDPRVRRALTLAINRREMLRVLNLPDNSPIFDGVYTIRQIRLGQFQEPLPYDPAQARALLDAAGWRDQNGDGVRHRDGNEFRFTAIVNADAREFEQMAVYIRDQLLRVGVRMDLQPVDNSIIFERLKSGKFEAAIAFLNQSPGWLKRLFGEGSPIGYKNAKVVQLINQAQVAGDPDVLDRVYDEITQILRADLPVAFLGPFVDTQFVHRRIRGLSSPWRADLMLDMEDLWLED